ncbi:unnamed protein product [Rhizophagus irregularis]|nr:unnamed protein product [Rhizophagus irregularis]
MENQETKIRKFGWASEEQKPKDSFVNFRGSGKGELRFGWLLKPRFVHQFGFRWASEEQKRTKILERVNQRLGIEINSFALSGSNCFGFLISDDRID